MAWLAPTKLISVFRNSEPAEGNTQKELTEKIPYPLEVVVIFVFLLCKLINPISRCGRRGNLAIHGYSYSVSSARVKKKNPSTDRSCLTSTCATSHRDDGFFTLCIPSLSSQAHRL